MVENNLLRQVLNNPHLFFEGAEPCDFFERLNREFEVGDLKELYSKEYLFKMRWVTPEEYETIPATRFRVMERKRDEDWGRLANRVVGHEGFEDYEDKS